MASTISAGTTGGTAIAIAGDTSGALTLQTNGTTTALTINTAQGVQALNCIGVGNATPSTSGAGITFPATQSASTDANTLDDYEEGNWTPVLGADTTNPTVTYDAQVGTYTKIGRMVMIQMYIGTTARTGGSGNVRITGLPFTAANSSASYCGVTPSQAQNITGATTVGVRPFANQAYLELMNNSGATNVVITNWSATGTILVTLSYIV
jgi:hypothetical protein